jgi:hypothetical protein
MSRTLLVKKLIGVVGEEGKEQYAECFGSLTKKTLSFRGHVMSILEESLGKPMNPELDFGPPLVVASHHVRRFFNKLQLGIHAIQNYLDKKLNTRDEAVNYFINTIGAKAYGPDWMYEELIKRFKQEDQGLFLVTDLTLAEAQKLKSMLGSSFALVFVGDAGDQKVDFSVEQQKSKGAAKRVAISVMDKITQNQSANRRNANERPTSEPQLQS